MELTNEFRVSVPPAKAWKVLTDVERIAPMLPGAQLQEIEGDEFRGIIKVKVGPITAQYKGKASWVERDEDAGRVVLKASGRDTRGQGNASATITSELSADGDGTKVNVTTDLTITGKVAQFGRGVLADVSGKLIGQFVDALESDLRQEGEAPSASASATGTGPAATTAATGTGPAAATDATGSGPAAATDATGTGPGADTTDSASAAAPTGTEQPPGGARRIDHPEPRPVDLIDAAGSSVAKRLIPVLCGSALVALYLAFRRSRRRSRRR